MRIKKWTAIFLTALFLLTAVVFTGCQNQSTPNTQEGTEKTTNTEQTSDTTNEADKSNQESSSNSEATQSTNEDAQNQ